jgi:fructosamine-3-kinase
MTDTPTDIFAALRRLGLLGPGPDPQAEPLTGGVSSDIWRVALADRTICVKRALDKLKVAQDWRAPVERNGFEVAWMDVVGAIVPGAVPRLIAVDPAARLFAMEFLDPVDHKLWKAQLRDGVLEPETAHEVGVRLAHIHAATADRADIAARFRSDTIFHAIRLEPYLEATGRAHPDLAAPIATLVARTAATRRALVHGDVSPKNILAGPRGPVFLDAECAWYGDPAFDLAFCLNHLLLKCVWNRAATGPLLAAFEALKTAYLDGPASGEIEARTAHLLPALLLARIDGKSPVEYIVRDDDREMVRSVAIPLVARPPGSLDAVRDAWAARLGQTGRSAT